MSLLSRGIKRMWPFIDRWMPSPLDGIATATSPQRTRLEFDLTWFTFRQDKVSQWQASITELPKWRGKKSVDSFHICRCLWIRFINGQRWHDRFIGALVPSEHCCFPGNNSLPDGNVSMGNLRFHFNFGALCLAYPVPARTCSFCGRPSKKTRRIKKPTENKLTDWVGGKPFAIRRPLWLTCQPSFLQKRKKSLDPARICNWRISCCFPQTKSSRSFSFF